MCNFEIPITIPETNQNFIVTPATTVNKFLFQMIIILNIINLK
jgi:hypothetical protein